jgi:hypothetical protein
MAEVPYWKRRRLGARVLRIMERRASQAPALKAYETSLVPLTNAFNQAYDACANAEARWRKELKEGKGAVAALLAQIRAWAPVLQGSIEGFKASDFGDHPAVPDDVIFDGEQLLDMAMDAKDASGQPLAFAAELQSALEPALKAAIKEWKETEEADKQYQSLLATTRETGDAFNAQLILFRRTFAAIFGRSDKDFQRLRAERVAESDDDDDVMNTPPAGPPTP